ncbi:MAG: hypothetical protein ABIH89_00745 [Elusimicrobiota bacterium]
MGIKTLKELGNTPAEVLARHFGFMGHILKRMGQGRETSPIEKYSADRIVKSVGHSNTLAADTHDPEILKSFLFILSARVAVRLRRYSMRGKRVSLHIRHNDFSGFSRQKSLASEINSGEDIYINGCRILDEILPADRPVRLIGVTVSKLVKDTNQQYLFNGSLRKEKLSRLMDSINETYGEFTLRPLSFEIAAGFTGKITGKAVNIPSRVHGFIPRH